MIDRDARAAWKRVMRGPDGPLIARLLVQVGGLFGPLPLHQPEATWLMEGRRAAVRDLFRIAGLRPVVVAEPLERDDGDGA